MLGERVPLSDRVRDFLQSDGHWCNVVHVEDEEALMLGAGRSEAGRVNCSRRTLSVALNSRTLGGAPCLVPEGGLSILRSNAAPTGGISI